MCGLRLGSCRWALVDKSGLLFGIMLEPQYTTGWKLEPPVSKQAHDISDYSKSLSQVSQSRKLDGGAASRQRRRFLGREVGLELIRLVMWGSI